MSGTTVGQWARHGLIRASQSAALPHVYSVEDAAEAAIVAALLARGVRHREVHRAAQALAPRYGTWPLSEARLATADGRPFLREGRDVLALSPRGWQVVAVPPALEEVHLRLRGG